MIKINKSPVSTSKNYGINNFDFDETLLCQSACQNITLKHNETLSQINIKELAKSEFSHNNISAEIDMQSQNVCNFAKKVVFNKNSKQAVVIDFEAEKQFNLVDNIVLHFSKDTANKVIIKYAQNEIKYHNDAIKVVVESGASASVAVMVASKAPVGLVSIDVTLGGNSKLDLQIFDFGSNNAVQNIKVDALGDNSSISLLSLYFGQSKERLSLNYLFNISGKKCDAKMNAFGVLFDNAEKNFVGTIDFKKGSKKSMGEENEFCMLLSSDAKAKSTPVLLSAEEDVDGKHASSVGYIDPAELFYVESRGLSQRDATKLLVKAKLAVALRQIFDADLKTEIEKEIDKKLDGKS